MTLRTPAFIFIDELDRCRPTYAIELLERVKHFFELEDCRFIVASDSTQLAHSVRAVYGEKFYSERYLSRFFDAEFRLDNSNTLAIAKQAQCGLSCVALQISTSGYASAYGLESPLEPKSGTICTDEKNYPEHALILVGLARYFKVELREMLRYAQQINSMTSALPPHNFHYFWAAYLIFSKAASEDLYQALGIESKAYAAIDLFDTTATPVNYTFSGGYESVADLAKFYARLVNCGQDELRQMLNNSQGWRSSVTREAFHRLDVIRNYRKLVELAHRIS